MCGFWFINLDGFASNVQKVWEKLTEYLEIKVGMNMRILKSKLSEYEIGINFLNNRILNYTKPHGIIFTQTRDSNLIMALNHCVLG